MEHAMKVVERVVNKMIREIVDIDVDPGLMQLGLVKGNGTIYAIWSVRQIQQKVLERNTNLYCAFVNFEKSFDRFPREVTCWRLTNCEISRRNVQMSRMRAECGASAEFPVTVGLHQGRHRALSHLW